jgi:hypothetical protein
MIRPKTLIYKLYLLLTISSLNTFGQEGNKFEVKAKFHPSALLALSRPTMLGSIEFKLKKIGLDIAYGQQWGFLLSSTYSGQRGPLIPEQRGPLLGVDFLVCQRYLICLVFHCFS